MGCFLLKSGMSSRIYSLTGYTKEFPKQLRPKKSNYAKEKTEILLYTASSGKVKVEIFLHNENVWLTQEKIAQLFGVQRPAIKKRF